MLFSSPIFSQASGSVAGLTFAHCRAGMTVRSRSTPTNPDTARQRVIKHALARLSPHWGQSLTQGERDAWNLYGANVVMTNALGQAFNLTGQNHFLRANIPRIQSAIPVLETAPGVFDMGTFTLPFFLDANEVPQRFRLGIDPTDDWANGVGGYLLVYMGRPANPGRAFFAGPYRFIRSVPGAPAPPAAVQTFTPDPIISAGQLLWVLCRVIQIDGRLSMPIVLGPKAVS